jgi:RNase H-fold protein (predicted Holliday junction resolvase)
MSMVMAVDPGDVRIGLAVSDPSGTISRPLKGPRRGNWSTSPEGDEIG